MEYLQRAAEPGNYNVSETEIRKQDDLLGVELGDANCCLVTRGAPLVIGDQENEGLGSQDR